MASVPTGSALRRLSVASADMNGQQWRDDYRQRLAEIDDRVREAGQRLATLRATASSRDGAVMVTVDPAGALVGLAFAEPAGRLSRAELAELVLDTARAARARAGSQALAAVAAVAPDPEVLRMLRAQLPGTDA
jgi:hypothetical protein